MVAIYSYSATSSLKWNPPFAIDLDIYRELDYEERFERLIVRRIGVRKILGLLSIFLYIFFS